MALIQRFYQLERQQAVNAQTVVLGLFSLSGVGETLTGSSESIPAP